LAAAAALCVMLTGLSFAAEAPPPQCPSAQTAEAVGLERIDGQASDVNPVERTMRVGNNAGLFPEKIWVGPSAQVVTGTGQQASLGEVREGDRVQATYHTQGAENVADCVVVFRSQDGCP
jgi:hypothetical protein